MVLTVTVDDDDVFVADATSSRATADATAADSGAVTASDTND